MARIKDNEDYIWMGDHHFNGNVTGIEIEFEGVQSITGDGVGGTAENPVLSYPTPADIGAATAAQGALASSSVQPATLDSRLSAAQRTAINALVSPTTDYSDMTEATAAVKAIIDALQV